MTSDASTFGKSIAPLLSGYSIEVSPSDTKAVDTTLHRLPQGTEVYLTWIPDSNPMEMARPATRLQRGGLIPVPHVGARHLESSTQLEEFAGSLVDAGVNQVLVVGGDRHKPAGPYDSSMAVMQTGIFQRNGIVRMAIGGFPEGNPNISDNALDQSLTGKVIFARSEGIELSIITQFCFKAEPIICWLKHIRGRGIDIPVRVGLAGPAGLMTLLRYAMRCGIGNSMHVLTQHPSFAKLLTEEGPRVIIRDLAAASHDERTHLPPGIAGLHFFVFGGLNKTLDWINAELNR